MSSLSAETKQPPQLSAKMFSRALRALCYEDGERKQSTLYSIQLVEEAMATNHPDALILKGIERSHFPGEAFKYFSEAESRGSTHPLLYYHLGQCYCRVTSEITRSSEKAIEYFTRAIQGGCTLGHLGIFLAHRDGPGKTRGDEEAAFNYLLDVEAKGEADSHVLYRIACCYSDGDGTDVNEAKAMEYYHRLFQTPHNKADDTNNNKLEDNRSYINNCNIGYVWGCLGIHEAWWYGKGGRKKDQNRAVLLLMDGIGELERVHHEQINFGPSSEQEGEGSQHNGDSSVGSSITTSVRCEDVAGIDRLIERILHVLCYTSNSKYRPNEHVLGEFNSVGELALFYANKLVKYYPALGYYWQCRLLLEGKAGVTQDVAKAAAIFEEGKRNNALYHSLYYYFFAFRVYSKGLCGTPKNGARVLELCISAFRVANSVSEIYSCYKLMASIYEEGLPPIAKDEAKAKELNERAETI